MDKRVLWQAAAALYAWQNWYFHMLMIAGAVAATMFAREVLFAGEGSMTGGILGGYIGGCTGWVHARYTRLQQGSDDG